MAFQKGNKKGTGRGKGTPNKLTRSVKECFEVVFTKIQDNPKVKLEKWAVDNPTEFYKLCAKLIPAAIEVKAEISSIKIIRE